MFGFSVSVSGDTAVVGAYLDNCAAGGDCGSAYVFSTGPDSDGDGVIDDCDPCPLDNPDDPDADGVCDGVDLCPGTPLGLVVDIDGCVVPEGSCCFPGNVCLDGVDRSTCEAFAEGSFQGEGLTCGDPDGDGVAGCADGCPLDPGKFNPGVCGCGVVDDDADDDGVVGCMDQCPETPLGVAVNVCGCTEEGACCAAAGACVDQIERAVCVAIQGIYQGDGSSCTDGCSFGDLDADGDIDARDYAVFARCFSGAAGGASPDCAVFDADGCGPIDLDDFSAFRAAISGP